MLTFFAGGYTITLTPPTRFSAGRQRNHRLKNLWFLHFMEISKERTCIYVDGFNLYYGALNKNMPGLKWLDLHKWFSGILLQNEIITIKFFTAKVSGKYDRTQPDRQKLYWQALRTLPNVTIIEGTFLFSPKKIHITEDVSLIAKISEEKGTDVNIAVHLVNDAHLKKFETAIIVSNDSDLAEAIRIVTQELELKVGIVNPYPAFNKQIIKYATFKMPVRETALKFAVSASAA